MTVQDVGEWNNFYMVVKGVIDDDGLRKDFFQTRSRPSKNSQERSRGPFWGPLSIRNDSEEQRQGSFPAVSQTSLMKLASARRSFQAPRAYLEGNIEH